MYLKVTFYRSPHQHYTCCGTCCRDICVSATTAQAATTSHLSPPYCHSTLTDTCPCSSWGLCGGANHSRPSRCSSLPCYLSQGQEKPHPYNSVLELSLISTPTPSDHVDSSPLPSSPLLSSLSTLCSPPPCHSSGGPGPHPTDLCLLSAGNSLLLDSPVLAPWPP